MLDKSKMFSCAILVLTLILLGLLIFITIQGNYYKTSSVYVEGKYYQNNNVDDFIWIIPYFIILIISPLIILIKSKKLINWIKFSINGLIIGGGISLLIILVSILPRLNLIISDGTSFWAFLWLPIIFIGYSSIILGAIIGLIISWIRGKIKNKVKYY